MEMARIAVALGLSLSLGLELKVNAEESKSGPVIGKDVEEPGDVGAFRSYWSAFDQYEERVLREGKKRYLNSWNRIREEEQRIRRDASAQQLGSLRKAARGYKEQLDRADDVDNRPQILLNYAQVLNLIGDNLHESDPGGGEASRDEALAILTTLIREYPGHELRSQALYLRALIFEARGQSGEAREAWRQLATAAKSDIYGVFAWLALGDHEFDSENASKSLSSYQSALTLLNRIAKTEHSSDRIRIQYRIAWAAYRSANLEAVLPAAKEILAPGISIPDANQRAMMQADATELIGDALYENGILAKMKEVLIRREFLAFAPAIGLRIMERYSASDIFEPQSELGEFLVEQAPGALEIPEILNHLAIAYQKIERPGKRIAALEKLSLLLPRDSLWRARHKSNYQKVKRMEELAVAAAKLVASWHYERGMGSGSQKSFRTADDFYGMLIDFDPTGAEASTWRLRRGHSNYFSGKLDQASQVYSSVKEEFKVRDGDLQIAGYQLVLTKEKMWRAEYTNALNRGDDPQADDKSVALIKDLAKAIDEFANRFPSQSRSVDVLLVGASAYRDQGVYPEASRYWQRVLVSNPNASQRATAIRGLVFAAMKDGSATDVIKTARRFLKLEDADTLGMGLSKELQSVLSAATLDEGKRLNQDGKLGEAGQLLVEIAKEFPSLPNRPRIFRDGGYMLALAGDWAGAATAAEAFLAGKTSEFRGDMVYLQARSQEFQIRFGEAARSYLSLGRDFPGHSRAVASLERSEKLSVAEDQSADAGLAARMLGDREKNHEKQLDHYERSVRYYEQAGSYAEGKRVAQIRLKASKSRGENLTSQLLVANIAFKMGDEDEAIEVYRRVGVEADRYRQNIGEVNWAKIAGEAYFKLGEDARTAFEDFNLIERDGSAEGKVEQKARYFAMLSDAYQRASESARPEWAAPARFYLAQSAERFADEIAGLLANGSFSPTTKTQRRYESQISRFKELARTYHNKNILAQRKDPARYFENEWVKKSGIQLGGGDGLSTKVTHSERIPEAIHLDLPYQWSL